MNDIIRMAREAGFDLDGMANMLYTVRGNYAQLERFAALVRADEREQCAIAGGAAAMAGMNHLQVADAIRTRGQA